ncbi:MAG TPA: hypothetical protein VGG75_31535 [Trebonia sp.]
MGLATSGSPGAEAPGAEAGVPDPARGPDPADGPDPVGGAGTADDWPAGSAARWTAPPAAPWLSAVRRGTARIAGLFIEGATLR